MRAPRETAAYWFDLPPHAIATTPANPRDASRLLAVRAGGEFDELIFRDIVGLFRSGDVLVINETRVIRARLHGKRASGGAAEVLLLRPADAPRYSVDSRRWLALVRPGRRLGVGAEVAFGDAGRATVLAVHADGVREIALDIAVPFETFLHLHGSLPLPPYVGAGNEQRAQGYQTVFARVPGSVAAPTASLHFTDEVLDRIRNAGVAIVPVVLEVGLGTFKPIESRTLDEHVMHSEYFRIPEATALAVAAAKAEGRRIVAAGTTSLRALEGGFAALGGLVGGEGETAIFITPGFDFEVVDALITNFHLPGSTLLALVSAFAGYERTMAAYAHAIRREFRFFSFGDAMFVERQA